MLKKCLACIALASAVVSTTSAQDAKAAVNDASKAMGVDKLKSVQEGESSLLDKTLIVYGSPMGDSNLHNHRRCPLILLGGANGKLAGNTHIKAPDATPMANALLTVAHTLGMDDMKTLGDSTGALSVAANA